MHVMPEQRMTLVAAIETALAGLDLDWVRQAYWEQDESVFLDQFLAPEVERLRADVHRSHIPQYRKAGAVDCFTLVRKAPLFLELYRSRAFREFLGRLVGARLRLCPETDPHACALYCYTEPRDHMAWHDDISYYRGARSTGLLGLSNRSSSRLLCQLHKDHPEKITQEVALVTHPGCLVIFNGEKLYHAVTPLGAGEDRVIFSMQYVVTQEMGWGHRLVSDLKDAFGFFGVRTVLARARRATG